MYSLVPERFEEEHSDRRDKPKGKFYGPWILRLKKALHPRERNWPWIRSNVVSGTFTFAAPDAVMIARGDIVAYSLYTNTKRKELSPKKRNQGDLDLHSGAFLPETQELKEKEDNPFSPCANWNGRFIPESLTWLARRCSLSLVCSHSTFKQHVELPMIRKDQAYEKQNIDAPDKDNELFAPAQSMKYYSNGRTVRSAAVINRPNAVRHSSTHDENKASEEKRQQRNRFARHRFSFCMYENTKEEQEQDRTQCVSTFRILSAY